MSDRHTETGESVQEYVRWMGPPDTPLDVVPRRTVAAIEVTLPAPPRAAPPLGPGPGPGPLLLD